MIRTLTLFLLLISLPVGSDGSPFIRVFQPSDYKGDPQTYCGVQGPDGMMYFGNNQGGVLEFDGKTWRFIAAPDLRVIRSVAVGSDGKIYAGSTGELGFIDRDSLGISHYRSLLHLIPDSLKNFKEIWKISVFDQAVWFLSTKMLFQLKDGRFTAIPPGSGHYYSSFVAGSELYVTGNEIGLMKVSGQSLVPVSNHPIIKSNAIPFGFYSPNGELILVSEFQGFFRLINGIPIPIRNQASEYLMQYSCYLHPMQLSGGIVAFPTLRGGVLITDALGNMKTVLSDWNGLPSPNIYSVVPDREGGLWIAGDNGLARVEFPSPWNVYSNAAGLKGMVLSLLENSRQVLAGTMQGLFIAQLPAQDTGSGYDGLVFSNHPDVKGNVWFIEQGKHAVLVASSRGLYEVRNNRVKKLNSLNQSSIQISKLFPGIIYVGKPDGISVYRELPDRIIHLGSIPAFHAGAYTIHEDASGDIWTGSFFEGVHRLRFRNGEWMSPQIDSYNELNGLPVTETFTAILDGKAVIITQNGLFRFEEVSGKFSLVPDFPHSIIDGASMVRQMNDSLLWVTNSDRLMQLTRKAGGYSIREYPFNRLPPGGLWALAPGSDGATWFGGDHGIFRYQPLNDSAKPEPASPHIRLVESDTLALPFLQQELNLLWSQRNIKIHYSAPSFDGDGSIQFQYFLDGFDESWSSWTTETMKEYTNLSPGKYRFRVRCRSVYGIVSDPIEFRFRVTPPWYNSWIAWMLWFGLLVLFIYLVVRWRLRKTQLEKIKLQKLVDEKTAELAQSYERLKQSQAHLIQSEKMASLGTLVAGIAHEINNPVNFINASIYPLRQDVADLLDLLNAAIRLEIFLEQKPSTEALSKELKEFSTLVSGFKETAIAAEIEQLITGIENGAYRTSEIVKSLRRFSRLDEHDMKPFDIITDLNTILKLLEKETSGRIEIITDFQHKRKVVGFPGEINQVLMNVMMNAIQAIPEKGTITIHTVDENESVRLIISDTGVGIPPENMSKLFDPFFTTRPIGKGTGLGLAVSYQIIHNHRGTIHISSNPGEGTLVTITLPVNQPPN